MVLEDPVTAIGVAAIVFFLLLGALYLVDLKLPEKRWFGIVFLLVGVTIATIGAMVAKRQLDRRGIVE